MLEFIKKKLRPYYRRIRAYREKRLFKRLLSGQNKSSLKIVIGSSGIYQQGWIPSEAHFLDLLDENTWKKYFANMLAEHVWEHLTADQGRIAAATCYKFLKKGGRLRVAVPDGFHKDNNYIDYVKPGGHGPGADDHKVLYNCSTFSAVFNEAGFKTELLEYFDESHNFHATDWKSEDGFVRRSIRYDERNVNGQPKYTSLVIDAIKL